MGKSAIVLHGSSGQALAIGHGHARARRSRPAWNGGPFRPPRHAFRLPTRSAGRRSPSCHATRRNRPALSRDWDLGCTMGRVRHRPARRAAEARALDLLALQRRDAGRPRGRASPGARCGQGCRWGPSVGSAAEGARPTRRTRPLCWVRPMRAKPIVAVTTIIARTPAASFDHLRGRNCGLCVRPSHVGSADASCSRWE